MLKKSNKGQEIGIQKLIQSLLKTYKWHVWTFHLYNNYFNNVNFRNYTLDILPQYLFDEVKIEFSYKPGERETRTEKFLGIVTLLFIIIIKKL